MPPPSLTLLGLDLEYWKLAASCLTGLAIFAAFLTYRRARQNESAKWLTEMVGKFYQFENIDATSRRRFESEFFGYYAPSMEKSLVYPEHLTDQENIRLAEIDSMLNFFEMIAHFSTRNRLLFGSDREAAFGYWFDSVMREKKSHAILRLYFKLGFENLRSRVGFPNQGTYVAVYGTLMKGMETTLDRPEDREECNKVRGRMTFLRACSIAGSLHDLGEYPGLWDGGSDAVAAELFEINGSDREIRTTLRMMDDYEECNVDGTGLYVRRYVKLKEPIDTAAWVYFLREAPGKTAKGASSDWRRHIERKLAR